MIQELSYLLQKRLDLIFLVAGLLGGLGMIYRNRKIANHKAALRRKTSNYDQQLQIEEMGLPEYPIHMKNRKKYMHLYELEKYIK